MKGLEELKKILGEGKLHVYLGMIQKLHLAKDRSYLKVSVSVLPEERTVISTMTWDSVGEDSGDFEFPTPGDLVLLVNAEGDDDNSFVIKRLTSRADKIPQAAADGDKVHRAKAGNKYWNVSNTKILLARGDAEPSENLVLGQVFKSFMQVFLEIAKENSQNSADHKHIGNLGYFTSKPDLEPEFLLRKEEYNEIKESPIDDELILSDLSFTEK